MLTAWASGTGSAGIIGSFSWAGLIALGLSPSDTLRIMLIMPVIQAATFWLLLRAPQQQTQSNSNNKSTDIAAIESNECSTECISPAVQEEKLSGLKAKLKFLPQLSSFILPLVMVFISDYVCVSALVNFPFFHQILNLYIYTFLSCFHCSSR